MKFGEYEFVGQLSPFDIATKIFNGEVATYNITIPEGRTMVQIQEIFNQHEKLSGELTDLPPEGAVFPDTWQYVKGDKRQDILNKMVIKMTKTINEVWQNRDPNIPLNNPDQLVILASIIERETKLPAERPRVAGVFYNRLRQNMRLESDPTAIYPISQFRGELNRRLTLTDLKQINNWNTYIIYGLPKTAIANPSLESLQAAAHPESNKYIFFVANGENGHYFAETYQQHLKNVALYRQSQND